MIIFSKRGVALLSALGLAGCAHQPPFEVIRSGPLPAATGASFSFVPLEEGKSDFVRARLTQCLGEKGLVAVAGKADYLVEENLVDRPGSTGAFLPDAQPAGDTPDGAAKGKEPLWLTGFTPTGKRKVRLLSVGLTQIGSGQEVYRLSVAERYRRSADEGAPVRLVDAVCREIAAP